CADRLGRRTPRPQGDPERLGDHRGHGLMRRVAYVTGTRADYGLFSEPLKRIREHPRLELSLIVTGMHLEPQFGSTINEIEADAMPIAARVQNLTGGDTGADQARSV